MRNPLLIFKDVGILIKKDSDSEAKYQALMEEFRSMNLKMARRVALAMGFLVVVTIFLFIYAVQVNKSSADKITQFEKELIECESK